MCHRVADFDARQTAAISERAAFDRSHRIGDVDACKS